MTLTVCYQRCLCVRGHVCQSGILKWSDLQAQKQECLSLKPFVSLLNGIMEQCDDGHSGQDREENFTQYSSCTAGKYDTVSTGMSITSAIITAEKKHGTLGREAEADHPQVRRLAMCKYEIIILLKMSHHFIFLLQRALFIQHYSSSCTTMGIM